MSYLKISPMISVSKEIKRNSTDYRVSGLSRVCGLSVSCDTVEPPDICIGTSHVVYNSVPIGTN